MLSAAKHLGPCGGETLRCAQSDSLMLPVSEQPRRGEAPIHHWTWKYRGEAISLLRHERDCFPFAAPQGFGFCAAQKFPPVTLSAAKSLAPAWAEMLRYAQHDDTCQFLLSGMTPRHW